MKFEFKNGNFRIMQVADIQEIPYVSPDSIRMLTLAIEHEKPDLIVFSGDQLYGLLPVFRGNTGKKVDETLSAVIKPIEDAGIPFAVTFGNHDCQCGLTNLQQIPFYEKHKGFVCAASNGDDNDGVAFIPVYDGDEAVFNIVLIDSNSSAPDGSYLPVSERQLESYRRLRDEYGRETPCMVIQHIPTDEYYNVIKKVPFGTKGSVEAFRTHKNEYYVLPDDIKADGGFMLESPATPDVNSGELGVLNETGNCLALSVGHDHNNSFVAGYDGMKLIYTQGCGFNVYGPGKNRGVRIFDIKNDGGITLDTHTVTWKELTDGSVTHPLEEFVLTHIPTSLEQVKEIAAFGLGGIAVTAAAAAIIVKTRHK